MIAVRSTDVLKLWALTMAFCSSEFLTIAVISEARSTVLPLSLAIPPASTTAGAVRGAPVCSAVASAPSNSTFVARKPGVLRLEMLCAVVSAR